MAVNWSKVQMLVAQKRLALEVRICRGNEPFDP